MKRPFQNLLVPVSFHERTEAIYSYARRIAQVNHGRVTLFHAVPTQSYRLLADVYRPAESGGANQEHAEQVSRERLEALAAEHLRGVETSVLVRGAANPAKAVLEVQREIDSDLVLVGKSQSGALAARLQGGLIEKLIRSSPCPVLSVSMVERLAAQESVRTVLAPIALDRSAATVVRLARSIAEPQQGRVILIHVLGTDPSAIELRRDAYGFGPDERVSLGRAQRAAEEKLAALAKSELGPVPRQVVVTIAYDLASAILDEERAHEADMIVMATAGYTGFFQFVLGSAAETVARRAEASVMTIRIGD
jgi:nucleotide-binding universal stress UspA family protein